MHRSPNPLKIEVWCLHYAIDFWYVVGDERRAKSCSLHDTYYGGTSTRAEHYAYYKTEVDYAGIVCMCFWAMRKSLFLQRNFRLSTISNYDAKAKTRSEASLFDKIANFQATYVTVLMPIEELMGTPGNGDMLLTIPQMDALRPEHSNLWTDKIRRAITLLIDCDADEDSEDAEVWDSCAAEIAYAFGMRAVQRVLLRLVLFKALPRYTVDDDDDEEIEVRTRPR